MLGNTILHELNNGSRWRGVFMDNHGLPSEEQRNRINELIEKDHECEEFRRGLMNMKKEE